MTDTSSKIYPPPSGGSFWVDEAEYTEAYKRSCEDTEAFWQEKALEYVDWLKEPTQVRDFSFVPPVSIRWFADGVLNVSANCLDRHLGSRGERTAIIWEADEPDAPAQHITYRDLYHRVCRLANGLRSLGVKKGDRVTLYMPMIVEGAVAMLACARIGAVHSVVFGGFSPSALADRMKDCDSRVLITADAGVRGGRDVPLKANADEACRLCGGVDHVVVLRHRQVQVDWQEGRDVDYHELVAGVDDTCEPEPMNAEDPLFILYTSGSTGKPKGVLHTTGGYLLYAAMTHKLVFDYHDSDVYWCTADIGWVTGHSYIVYGPLANGATTLMFEGVPTYPDASRFWRVVDKHRVSIFYTAPTAIRALMGLGDKWVTAADRGSLRLLGSVGEPINPEAWEWYHRVVGGGRCPIVDTWWQTETGGVLITPLAGATALKPGSATKPFFGVKPVIVDGEGKRLEGACRGALCMEEPWPGMMRTVFRDHKRFEQTYFSTYRGYYFSGDGCLRDEDGYYWITGRIDDVINVSGHRIGTAEVESALVEHESVSEAAVVGYPHDIKGQGIYAYVTLMKGVEPSDALRKELVALVRKIIGPFASPDKIQWAVDLPKTRSGKIMRRILRKIVHGEADQLGDVSTLADPTVVDGLIEGNKKV
ncbi:MAG: acetate--CoA ligase [Alphaproteobacteria bacterium GM202ARS2]|nr:acetate--CoA ligase [Alphaproteobacteria bacterium GM202ARS2]